MFSLFSLYLRDQDNFLVFFIHITKNAGTSIENACFKNGIKVGRYFREFWEDTHPELMGKVYWHLPLTQWPYEKIEALRKYTTFCVLRDPIDRVVSEYNCQWGNQISKSSDRRVKNYVILKYVLEATGLLRPSMAPGHWIPQHRYVYLKKKQVIDHFLLFSNLKEDWTEFAEKNGLPTQIEKENRGHPICRRRDLYLVTRLIVRICYWKDYNLIRRIKTNRRRNK